MLGSADIPLGAGSAHSLKWIILLWLSWILWDVQCKQEKPSSSSSRVLLASPSAQSWVSHEQTLPIHGAQSSVQHGWELRARGPELQHSVLSALSVRIWLFLAVHPSGTPYPLLPAPFLHVCQPCPKLHSLQLAGSLPFTKIVIFEPLRTFFAIKAATQFSQRHDCAVCCCLLLGILLPKTFRAVQQSAMGCWRLCAIFFSGTGREMGLLEYFHTELQMIPCSYSFLLCKYFPSLVSKQLNERQPVTWRAL